MTSIVKNKSKHDTGKCKVHLVHVQVQDVKKKIQEVFEVIRDTSWIEKLASSTAKLSYSATMEKTVEKLTNEIFSSGTSALTEKTGEYVVSVSTVTMLSQEYGHIEVPISELWKEQKSGNPGFDFHSVNPENILIFGEAKYKSNPPSPHGTAFKQMVDLISDNKDVMDLIDLEHLVGVFPIDRFKSGHKGYAAAFSLNAENCETVMNNALGSELAKPLLEYSELYIVGVEFAK